MTSISNQATMILPNDARHSEHRGATGLHRGFAIIALIHTNSSVARNVFDRGICSASSIKLRTHCNCTTTIKTGKLSTSTSMSIAAIIPYILHHPHYLTSTISRCDTHTPLRLTTGAMLKNGTRRQEWHCINHQTITRTSLANKFWPLLCAMIACISRIDVSSANSTNFIAIHLPSPRPLLTTPTLIPT